MLILEHLSKKDKEWRKAAYRICEDKMLADDIVQVMYLKMSKANTDKFFTYNEGQQSYYIFNALNYIFLDHLRKNKNRNDMRLDDLDYIEDTTEPFEPNDEQLKVLEEFDKLDWVKQELLIERANGMSLRDIEKRYNINYGYTYRETTEAKKTILNNIRDERTKR